MKRRTLRRLQKFAPLVILISSLTLIGLFFSLDGLSSDHTIVVKGVFTCLPHKDTSGPQTQECALGLKTPDGKYYALNDTTPNYSLLSKLSTGKLVKVRGTLSPNQNSIYNAAGVINLKTVE